MSDDARAKALSDRIKRDGEAARTPPAWAKKAAEAVKKLWPKSFHDQQTAYGGRDKGWYVIFTDQEAGFPFEGKDAPEDVKEKVRAAAKGVDVDFHMNANWQPSHGFSSSAAASRYSQHGKRYRYWTITLSPKEKK
jgi:hypothetical protein